MTQTGTIFKYKSYLFYLPTSVSNHVYLKYLITYYSLISLLFIHFLFIHFVFILSLPRAGWYLDKFKRTPRFLISVIN